MTFKYDFEYIVSISITTMPQNVNKFDKCEETIHHVFGFKKNSEQFQHMQTQKFRANENGRWARKG